MDPITQGLLGGVAVQCLPKRGERRPPTWVGVLAGMAPDLDVLIHSDTDPLLFWEYHRHFTHSLAFIPIGGFLVALILFMFPGVRRRYSFYTVCVAAVVGWATHGLLDAMTSYGTLLYWPFSQTRVSWNVISIIDPIFSGTLLVGLLWSWRSRRPRPARWAVLLALIYLALGWWQHHRAANFQEELALSRGHEVHHSYVNPSFGNLLVWRSIYEDGGNYYVDALRIGPWGPAKIWYGGSTPAVDLGNAGKEWIRTPRLRKDLSRFSWFTQGYMTFVDGKPNQIGDLRFSVMTAGLKPIWGLGLEKGRPPKIEMLRFSTNRAEALEDLAAKLKGLQPDQELP